VNPETGTLFVADSGNHVIRAIRANGQVTTLAGTGAAALADGPGDEASFLDLKGMVFHRGFLIVADGCTLRSVDAETGATTTLVGTPHAPGFTPYVPMDDIALDGDQVRLGDPHGLSLDGNWLLVTDRANHTVHLLRLPQGDPLAQIQGPATFGTLAGGPERGTFKPGLLRDDYPGTLASRQGSLEAPLGAAFDGRGNVVVTTGIQVATLNQAAAAREEVIDLYLPGLVTHNHQDANQMDAATGVPLDLGFHFRRLGGSRTWFVRPAYWMAEVVQAGQAGPQRVAWAEETDPRTGGRVSIVLPEAGRYDLHVAWVMPDGQAFRDTLSLHVEGETVDVPAAITLAETGKSLESKG